MPERMQTGLSLKNLLRVPPTRFYASCFILKPGSPMPTCLPELGEEKRVRKTVFMENWHLPKPFALPESWIAVEPPLPATARGLRFGDAPCVAPRSASRPPRGHPDVPTCSGSRGSHQALLFAARSGYLIPVPRSPHPRPFPSPRPPAEERRTYCVRHLLR